MLEMLCLAPAGRLRVDVLIKITNGVVRVQKIRYQKKILYRLLVYFAKKVSSTAWIP